MVSIAWQAHSQTLATWGDIVKGAQMSISLTNAVLKIGSTNVLQCQIKNVSTNLLYFSGDPKLWIQVSLIDKLGRKIDLLPDFSRNPGGGPTFTLPPSEVQTFCISLYINDITPDEYKMVANISMYYSVHHPTKDDLGLRFFVPASSVLEAAQIFFCKIVEHQTEGWDWHSMLR